MPRASTARLTPGRCTRRGEGDKLDGVVLAPSRPFRIDFDYPDLDVFFLAMENSETITLNESNLTVN